jgi:DNA polymerase-3 subunit gamma/tau
VAPRRRPAEPPTDDIPLPPEPPPDDLPPEDPDARRRPAAAAPKASPAASPPASPRPVPEVQSVVLPPGPTVRPADDVPSDDDPDLEGSNLVGASVVEQLLGGRVIEERKD